MHSFSSTVLTIASHIPKGCVLSYSQVAHLAGSPKAVRAVGRILSTNTDYNNIFCYRVIHNNGNIGTSNRGAQWKAQILAAEGVPLKKHTLSSSKRMTDEKDVPVTKMRNKDEKIFTSLPTTFLNIPAIFDQTYGIDYALRYAIPFLSSGGIGIVPSDTLYGIMASATNQNAVERVYRTRMRDIKKPCIVLVANIAQLENIFGQDVTITKITKKFLYSKWPGKISIVLPCKNNRFAHLHRGTKTIAFRVPNWKPLQDLLQLTGPLIAPSANKQGMDPALTYEEAYASFGTSVDFYIDVGMRTSLPSTVVKIDKNEQFTILRHGAIEVK